MSPLLRLAANDLRLTLRDRAAAFWLLILPVFMIWIFGRMTSGGGPTKVALTLIDRDGGWLAQALAEELEGPGVECEVLRGEAALGAAAPQAKRWIELPPGFTAGALAGRQQRLKVESGEDAAADYSRAAEVAVARAIVRTLARAVEMKQASGELSLAAYDALRARAPLVALAVVPAGRGRAIQGFEQSVPGCMAFTVLMMTLIYGAVFLTIEKREGMIRRQLTLPISRETLFAGKILGRLAIAVMQLVILLAIGRILFQLDLGQAPVALALLLLAYAFAVAGIATFLGAVLANPEQASTVGWLVSMVMGALGGCWWPAEVMPDWLRTASHVFPTAWAMDGLHAVISFGRGLPAVVLPVSMLLVFGVGFSWLAARKLRTTVSPGG